MSSDPEFHKNTLTGWCWELPSVGCGHVFREADIWPNNVFLDLYNCEKFKSQNRTRRQWQKTICFNVYWNFFHNCHDYSAKQDSLFLNISNISYCWIFLTVGSDLVSLFSEAELSEKKFEYFCTVTKSHFSFGKFRGHCEHSTNVKDTVSPLPLGESPLFMVTPQSLLDETMTRYQCNPKCCYQGQSKTTLLVLST